MNVMANHTDKPKNQKPLRVKITPATKGQRPTTRYMFRMSWELGLALRERSELTGVPVPQIIRDLLAAHLGLSSDAAQMAPEGRPKGYQPKARPEPLPSPVAD
jgi:hypothetical protein